MTEDLKPINALEKRIMSDKEFLIAIQAGRIRQWHTEGAVRNHIIHILEYIDKHYKDSLHYEHLRIITLFHDVGKFARLHSHPHNYLPDGSAAQQQRFITASKRFSEKYAVPPAISKQIAPYLYTSQHAYISYLFAKKFLKDKRILEIIKYHDIAFDFKIIATHQGTYDVKAFKKIFSTIDIELYKIFLECDRRTKENNVSPWLIEQLAIHHIKKSSKFK